jgi:hypothetical protein
MVGYAGPLEDLEAARALHRGCKPTPSRAGPRAAAPRDPPSAASRRRASRAAAVPAQPALPTGGVGLVGDGAHDAARAALVMALAAGGPHDPDHRSEVIIDRSTLKILFGTGLDALRPWSRLQVTDDLDGALALLDQRLLQRARILDEHNVTDISSLREPCPDEEALPPMLLICPPPKRTMPQRQPTATVPAEAMLLLMPRRCIPSRVHLGQRYQWCEDRSVWFCVPHDG